MKKDNKRLLTELAVMLFFSITVFGYGPVEIISNNPNSFEYGIPDIWMIQAGLSFLLALIGAIILYLLPCRLSEILTRIVFAFSLGCYIQVMFLNGKMESILGQEISFSGSTIVVNLLIWLVVFVLVFAIPTFLKGRSDKVMAALAGLFFGMQLVALVAAVLGAVISSKNPDKADRKEGFLSTEGMLELAPSDNVVVFILDFFDGNTMNAILEERPDMLDGLDGFTYFPNCTSEYSRTYPSIDFLLTEEPCYFDKPIDEYIDAAFEHGTFIPKMKSAGTDIGIYTPSLYIGEAGKPLIGNYSYGELSVKTFPLIKYDLKMVLFRDMPYLLKPRFKYDPMEINNLVLVNSGASEPFPHSDDEWFDRQVVDNGISIGDQTSTFRFYHLGGVHLNLSDQTGAGIRALEITYDYLDEMKKKGIYETSTIIITTDHGSSGGFGGTLDLPQKTAVPLMIVKPSGSAGTPLVISNAPVSQRELQPTVLSELGIEHEGETFFEVPENEPRTRVYHYTGLYSDEEGEVELREYEVTGDARLPENYHFTGKTWDIIYSENKVAGK